MYSYLSFEDLEAITDAIHCHSLTFHFFQPSWRPLKFLHLLAWPCFLEQLELGDHEPFYFQKIAGECKMINGKTGLFLFCSLSRDSLFKNFETNFSVVHALNFGFKLFNFFKYPLLPKFVDVYVGKILLKTPIWAFLSSKIAQITLTLYVCFFFTCGKQNDFCNVLQNLQPFSCIFLLVLLKIQSSDTNLFLKFHLVND